MRCAIYGAGSLGTVLGSYITKGGVDIELINRNEGHISALKENGAVICGTVNFTQKVNAKKVSEMSGLYDIIFLMTKQQDNVNVCKFLKNYLSSDGVVVTFQNGIPELTLQEILGVDKVLGCTVAWGATLINCGVVELTSDANSLTFSLGSLSNSKNKRFDEVKNLLELMGKVETESNFIGVRWSKLLVNSAFSGMSAVLGCTFGEVAKNKESRKYAQLLIKECIDVCKKSNIKIEPIQGKDISKLFDYNNKFKKWIGFMIIPLAIKKHKLLKASMLQDLEKNKKCEIEAINGVICKCGREVGVKTPVNDLVVDIVYRIENKELTYSFDNLKLFRNISK